MLDLSAIAEKEKIIHEFIIKNTTQEIKQFNFFGEEDKNRLNIESQEQADDENYFKELSPSQLFAKKYGQAYIDRNVNYPWASDPNFRTDKEVIISLTNPYFAIRERMLIYNKCNSMSSLWLKNIVQDKSETKVYPDYEISSCFYLPESSSFSVSRIRKSTNSIFPGSLILFFYSMIKKKMNKELKTIGEIADSCPLSSFSKLLSYTKNNYKELDLILSEIEKILDEMKVETINILLPSLFGFSRENLSLKLQIPREILDKQINRVNPEKMYYRLNKANESYLDYISNYYINDKNLNTKYSYPRYIHLYKDGTTKCFYLAGKKEDGKAKFIDQTEFLNSEIDQTTKDMTLSINVNEAMKKHLEVLERDEQKKYLRLKELFPKFENIIKKIIVDGYKNELLINSL